MLVGIDHGSCLVSTTERVPFLVVSLLRVCVRVWFVSTMAFVLSRPYQARRVKFLVSFFFFFRASFFFFFIGHGSRLASTVSSVPFLVACLFFRASFFFLSAMALVLSRPYQACRVFFYLLISFFVRVFLLFVSAVALISATSQHKASLVIASHFLCLYFLFVTVPPLCLCFVFVHCVCVRVLCFVFCVSCFPRSLLPLVLFFCFLFVFVASHFLCFVFVFACLFDEWTKCR